MNNEKRKFEHEQKRNYAMFKIFYQWCSNIVTANFSNIQYNNADYILINTY